MSSESERGEDVVSSATDRIASPTSSTAGERLGEGHAIEAMHACFMIQEMVDRYLCDHPFIKQNEWLSTIAEGASEAVAGLYQAIGQVGADAYYSTPAVKPEP